MRNVEDAPAVQGSAPPKVIPRPAVPLAAFLAGVLAFQAGLLAQVPPPRPDARPRAAFRLAVVTSGKDVSGTLRKALDSAGTSMAKLSPREMARDGFAGADAALLDGAVIEEGSLGEDAIDAIDRAVKDGLGLIVLGGASAVLPESARWSRLIGRKEVLPLDPGGGIVLEVVSQSHPISQCVTHLAFTRARARAAGLLGEMGIGRALDMGPGGRDRPREGGTEPGASPPPPHVFWTLASGKGRIAVLAVDTVDAPAREEDALAFLAARMAQWAAREEITVRIPAALPLAALRLGPADPGALPGLPAQPGFYRGREIAPVMGWQAIDWLLRPDRDETERPEQVLDALQIAQGSTAADVGAGAGYFTFRLARRVGPGGRVIATDIQEEMLKALFERMAKEGLKNIEPVLATENDPRLPAGAVDLVLMVDVYHELSRPDLVAAAVARSLRPREEGRAAGRLVLVEYRGEDPSVPIKPLHRMTELQARAELEPLGFRWIETKGFLPHQHVIIFEKR